MTDEGRDARREVARTMTLERLQRLRGSTPVSPEQVDLVKMQEWFDGDFANHSKFRQHPRLQPIRPEGRAAGSAEGVLLRSSTGDEVPIACGRGHEKRSRTGRSVGGGAEV